MVSLPCHRSLSSGDTNWAKAPANLPDVLYKHVNDYLVKFDGGKAFQGGKSHLNQNIYLMLWKKWNNWMLK